MPAITPIKPFNALNGRQIPKAGETSGLEPSDGRRAMAKVDIWAPEIHIGDGFPGEENFDSIGLCWRWYFSLNGRTAMRS